VNDSKSALCIAIAFVSNEAHLHRQLACAAAADSLIASPQPQLQSRIPVLPHEVTRGQPIKIYRVRSKHQLNATASRRFSLKLLVPAAAAAAAAAAAFSAAPASAASPSVNIPAAAAVAAAILEDVPNSSALFLLLWCPLVKHQTVTTFDRM
jgi:hypothetical protein